MRDERKQEIRTAYRDRFLPARNEEWLASNLAAVEHSRTASEAQFRSADFQRSLWEVDGVAGIGPGSSVVVVGAYSDPEIVEALWQLRQWQAPDDVLARARDLDAKFENILALVTPRHNARRPSARLARIFAVLRPIDMLCLLDSYRTNRFRQWLEEPANKLSFIGQHVIARQALRETLGPENGLQDHVLYSQFSWFVWDHLLKPDDAEAATATIAHEGKATDTPQLTVLPAKVQRKGINFLSNNLDLLLSVVRAAENGSDRESLLQQIAEEAPAYSHGSRVNLLSQAPSLGLLSVEGGTYRPTAAGRALLEGEPPSEILTPVLVRTVFGFAHILDDLGRAGTLTRGQIAEACRNYYPRWTTDFAPNQLVSWMRVLGLIDVDGIGVSANISLTEAGEYWRSGLPANLKIPMLLLSDERPDEAVSGMAAEATIVLSPAFKSPSLEDILKRFRENSRLKTLVFSDAQIQMVHTALLSVQGKRFVLLAGLSGTGKTSMARGYAQAYCEALGLPYQTHYEQVAVWPDWTDPTGLLGFVNPLANPPAFQETRALRLLLAANANPDKPYFLCLDEMNLARVEHYFAPFLSAMEGGNGRLTIHPGRDAVDAIPPFIEWPANLFVIGTVNMDETTYSFSDKVLDRAFTFEFWDVELGHWASRASDRGENQTAIAYVLPILQEMSDALKPARRHFGYRTCDEVLGFVAAYPETSRGDALDGAVLAKILPKLRGDNGGALPRAIDAAIAVSAKHDLRRSVEKLKQMQATLAEMGTVRFWY
jgi:5-methylcytosine-specific restriction protein B